MKKKGAGAYFEYEEARNRDLMRVFGELRAKYPQNPLNDIYKMLVNEPSERFWVSEERASIVISSMIKGASLENMRKTKREMFQEIYRRVLALRESRPGESVYNLTFDVVSSPAPKFYLTPGSAKVIIHKIKHEWYEERQLRLRHLFM